MRENKIITDVGQLTPDWLTRIFRNKGYFKQGKITEIIKKRSQETVSSNIQFLELNFSDESQPEPACSEIVVKIPKSNEVSRFVGKHEAKFYRILAEMMCEMPIPICYDSAFSEESGLSHIILEDLSKTHVENFDYPPSKRNCERAVDCLAELHAFWWDHPMLKELSKDSYVLYTFKENSFSKKEIFKWFNNQKMALKLFLEFLGDGISSKSKELFKTIFSLYPQVAYERIAKENITVIHVDAHFSNFFYPKDILDQKYKTILPDWQTWSIGVGGQDLSYMIGLFFFPDYRDLIEKNLIKRYHNKLLKSGVKNYSWDECWYDYKLFAILNIYRIIWWWSVGMPSIVWWPKLEASISTIKDLNCMELLED